MNVDAGEEKCIHDEDAGYDGAHIVEVLSEDVEDVYLALFGLLLVMR